MGLASLPDDKFSASLSSYLYCSHTLRAVAYSLPTGHAYLLHAEKLLVSSGTTDNAPLAIVYWLFAKKNVFILSGLSMPGVEPKEASHSSLSPMFYTWSRWERVKASRANAELYSMENWEKGGVSTIQTKSGTAYVVSSQPEL